MKTIIEQFDEKYEIIECGEYSEQLMPNSCKKEPIRAFILKSLKEKDEEIIKEIEEMEQDHEWMDKRDCKGDKCVVCAYNQALLDVIKKLKIE